MNPALLPVERIERAILFLRGYKVMIDSDLAALYGVENRVLVQEVKCNVERFPKDFMFQLNNQEIAALKSQTVISDPPGRGGRRSAPYAFTEHGAHMAATAQSASAAALTEPAG